MKYESLFTVRDFTQPYENDHLQIANPEAFLRSLEPSPSVWLKKQFKNTDSYYTVDDGVECLRRVEGVLTARRLLQRCICKEPAVSAHQLGLGSVVYDQSSKMKGIICGWDATCRIPEGHFLTQNCSVSNITLMYCALMALFATVLGGCVCLSLS